MAYLLKRAIGLAIVLAIGLTGYNYFWGTEEEKANSQAIVGQVASLTKSVTSLLSSEKEKYSAGKYDDAIDKMSTTFSTLKQKAQALGKSGSSMLAKVEALQQEEQALADELHALDREANTESGGNMKMGAPSSDGQYSSSGGSVGYADRAEEIRQRLLELNHEAELLNDQLP